MVCMQGLSHQDYMNLALALAQKGRLSVSPNPMVGCLIVKNGEIIGRGYHKQPGEPHAEVYALKESGTQAENSSVYVTLEPCCHHGKTPPCTDALIEAGVKNVFIATRDPNPLVSGKGILSLKEAGIRVEVGYCEKEAIKLNEIFFHYIKTKTPFVISKWAMSLDGKTIVHPSDSKQISSQSSQEHTHQTRRSVDAILVGAQTVRDDNPALTVRYGVNKSKLKHPVRVIIAGRKPFSNSLKVFVPDIQSKTLIFTTNRNQEIFENLRNPSVEVIAVRENSNKQVSLQAVLSELGSRGISSVLVEGGMQIHESFFSEGLVNKIQVYLAPIIIGSQRKKHSVEISQMNQFDNDFYFVGQCKGEV